MDLKESNCFTNYFLNFFSKKFLSSLYYEPEDFYIKCKELNNSENGGVAVARGHTVSYIDPVEKIAVLSDGYEIHYDKCLIATGKFLKIT